MHPAAPVRIGTRFPTKAGVTALCLAAGLACAGAGTAATVSSAMPRKGDILNAAAAVGNHYRSVVPCPAATCAITTKWDDGVLMTGVIEHWRKHGTAAYKTYAESWAKKNAWTLFSDFSRDPINPNWHNRMTAGYTYLRLLQAGSPGATVANVTKNLNDQLALPLSPEQQGLVDHIFPGQTRPSNSWKEVDAGFMALPVWVVMGKHAGNASYYTRARDLQNYQASVMGLRDPATKLWYRDETFKSKTSPNGAKIIWGRGTGWLAAGLATTLAELPASRPEYATYRTRFTELMEAVRTRQRADGFWDMNIVDPKHYPAPETSATALITYAMAKGIHLGILSRSVYGPAAAKAWNAMVATSVAGDGHLGLVQGIGLQPVPPTHAGYPDEDLTAESNFGTGAFLLAGTAMHDIATASGTTFVKRYQAETLATTVSWGDTQVDVANRFASSGLANSATLGAVGDYVQFNTPNVPNGTYSLRVKFRRDPDNGIWQLKTNGVNTGTPTDGYDASGHYAEVDLGSVSYTGGPATKQYRFVVTGKNALSTGYGIGIDTISLFELASGQTLQSFLLSGFDGSTSFALIPDGNGAFVLAPVPLPPAAGLLAGGLCLLGFLRRAWRA